MPDPTTPGPTASDKAPPTPASGRLKFLVCVDCRPQSRVAVRFACRRATTIGGSVALLHVIERPEFQHWATVGKEMEHERHEDAQALLADLAEKVNEWGGLVPEVWIREGDIGDEILAQIGDDPTIDVLVVGAAAPTDKGFSLISFLAGKLVGKLSIPLVVVPADLASEKRPHRW